MHCSAGGVPIDGLSLKTTVQLYLFYSSGLTHIPASLFLHVIIVVVIIFIITDCYAVSELFYNCEMVNEYQLLS